MHRPGFVLAASILVFASSSDAEAQLKNPQVGTALKWDCTGPQSASYESLVAGVRGGLVRYEGKSDAGNYWVEQAGTVTGTTLWSRKIHDQFQWFHEDDFEGFEKLTPGTRFRGAVAALNGAAKFVWDYEVRVDARIDEANPVLGKVTLMKIVERRKIYHGDYWSRMTSDVSPAHGITVRWIYEDPAGVERCELAAFTPPALLQ